MVRLKAQVHIFIQLFPQLSVLGIKSDSRFFLSFTSHPFSVYYEYQKLSKQNTLVLFYLYSMMHFPDRNRTDWISSYIFPNENWAADYVKTRSTEKKKITYHYVTCQCFFYVLYRSVNTYDNSIHRNASKLFLLDSRRAWFTGGGRAGFVLYCCIVYLWWNVFVKFL